jgi:hypothetical protein
MAAHGCNTHTQRGGPSRAVPAHHDAPRGSWWSGAALCHAASPRSGPWSGGEARVARDSFPPKGGVKGRRLKRKSTGGHTEQASQTSRAGCRELSVTCGDDNSGGRVLETRSPARRPRGFRVRGSRMDPASRAPPLFSGAMRKKKCRRARAFQTTGPAELCANPSAVIAGQSRPQDFVTSLADAGDPSDEQRSPSGKYGCPGQARA